MKPTLKSVFPGVELGKNSDLTVDSINLSKKRRSMELALEECIDDKTAEHLEETLKDFLELSSIHIKGRQELEDEKLWASSRSYNTEFQRQIRESLSNHSDTGSDSDAKGVFMGKARVKSVIYGRSIRDFLVPISSIDENSGSVCFEGEIFNVETKDIHSKKTEKDFLLVMIDVTDYNDSVSCQLFIEKNDKNKDSIKAVTSEIKKGLFVVIKGKAQYNDYAKEAIVSIRSIAEG